MLTTLPPSCADSLEIWESQLPGTLRACNGIALPFFTFSANSVQAGWLQQGDGLCVRLSSQRTKHSPSQPERTETSFQETSSPNNILVKNMNYKVTLLAVLSGLLTVRTRYFPRGHVHNLFSSLYVRD